jgi:ribonuclease P protein component
MSKAPLRLKRRADFLRMRQGKTLHAQGFVLQAAPRFPAPDSRKGGESAGGQARAKLLADGESTDAQPRFGFTVSKRCGGAVRRNRIRRRLKEALRLVDPLPARLGYDYVIIARPEALRMAFSDLQAALGRALGRAGAGESSTEDRNDTLLAARGAVRSGEAQ